MVIIKKSFFTAKERSLLLDICNGLLYKDELALDDDEVSLLAYVRIKLLRSFVDET